MSAVMTRHLFTSADYHRMVEAGILCEDDRVELIEGEVLEMIPIGRRHKGVVNRLNHQLVRGVGDAAIVQVQGSIRLSKRSEPQPDVLLLRPRPDFYTEQDATPADVLLLIEVVDSTWPYDRDVKVPLYARAGIAEVWLMDLGRQRVLVFRQPAPGGYAEITEHRGSESLIPAALPNLALTVAGILGQQE